MKQDIRKQQLEKLLLLPRSEIEKEALMWQTIQYKNFMEEKYPTFPNKNSIYYSEWHFNMNTLRSAFSLYRQFFNTDLYVDYKQLINSDTDRIEKKKDDDETKPFNFHG